MRLIFLVVMMASAPAFAGEQWRKVEAEELGQAWPLTAARGTLSCKGNKAAAVATFTDMTGKRYALNGAARSQGYAPIDPIWKRSPENSEAQISISPLIREALKLCR